MREFHLQFRAELELGSALHSGSDMMIRTGNRVSGLTSAKLLLRIFLDQADVIRDVFFPRCNSARLRSLGRI